MSIRSIANAIWPKGTRRPVGVHNEAQRLKAKGGDLQVAGEAVESLQHTADRIMDVLSQPLPDADSLTITAPGGQAIINLGTKVASTDIYYGATFYDVNGGTQRGFLGIQKQAPKPVTGAVSSGGLIRLTVATHGYATRDTIYVADVGGVPAATGYWQVTVIGANTIDLVGSTFAGTYTSGGTAQRYFCGLLTEQIAIGTTFPSAKLRCWANGDLTLTDATITITSGTTTIYLDPVNGLKMYDSATASLITIDGAKVDVSQSVGPPFSTTMDVYHDYAGIHCSETPGSTTAELTWYSSGGGLIKWGLFINGTRVVGEQQASISYPSGGAVQDAEARSAIDFVIDALRAHGLIA
jgi:hypothetical protein